jgi:hypothetical protein
MSIKKLRKKKDENIISGIGEKGEFLPSLWPPYFSFFFSFYLIGKP